MQTRCGLLAAVLSARSKQQERTILNWKSLDGLTGKRGRSNTRNALSSCLSDVFKSHTTVFKMASLLQQTKSLWLFQFPNSNANQGHTIGLSTCHHV